MSGGSPAHGRRPDLSAFRESLDAAIRRLDEAPLRAIVGRLPDEAAAASELDARLRALRLRLVPGPVAGCDRHFIDLTNGVIRRFCDAHAPHPRQPAEP